MRFILYPLEKEVADTVMLEMNIKDDYVKNIFNSLKEKDPELAEFIERFSLVCEDPEMAKTCAAITYRLTERQAKKEATEEMRQAQQFLPEVTRPTKDVLYKQISLDNNYVLEIYNRLRLENPFLLNYVVNFSKMSKRSVLVMSCALFTYELLAMETKKDLHEIQSAYCQ